MRKSVIFTIFFTCSLLFTSTLFAGADPAILQATEEKLGDFDGDGTEETTYYTFAGYDEEYAQWENPEIRIFKKQNGKEVTGEELSQGTEYRVSCLVHNYGDETAHGVSATLGWADFGTGQDFTDVGTKSTDVEAGAEETLWFDYRATASGHICLQVTLSCDDDENDDNNWGQRNTNTADTTPGKTVVRRFIVQNKLKVFPDGSGGVKIVDVSDIVMKAFVRILPRRYNTEENRNYVKVTMNPKSFRLKGRQNRLITSNVTFDKELPTPCTILVNYRAIGRHSGRLVDGCTVRFFVNETARGNIAVGRGGRRPYGRRR